MFKSLAVKKNGKLLQGVQFKSSVKVPVDKASYLLATLDIIMLIKWIHSLTVFQENGIMYVNFFFF